MWMMMEQELITKRNLDVELKQGSMILGFKMKYNPNILPKRGGVMETDDKESMELIMNSMMDQELWIYYTYLTTEPDQLLKGTEFSKLKHVKTIMKVKTAKDGCYDKL